jgi:uncharacterized protein (TIGR00251 family)
LTPRARAERLEGIVTDAAGHSALKAAVTAPPEKGKANAALLALLAKAWRLPKTSLSVVIGAESRNKTVEISGDTRELMQRLKDWAGKHNG